MIGSEDREVIGAAEDPKALEGHCRVALLDHGSS